MKHRFQEVRLPGCAACHGNHNVQSPTDELLGMTDEAVCVDCHNRGRHGATFLGARIAQDMRQGMERLKEQIAIADAKLDHAERLGMLVSEPRFRLREANDALKTARTVVHSFALEPLQETLAVGMEISAASAQAADGAVAEYRYRRIWLGLSLVPIMIVIGFLLLYIRAMPMDTLPDDSPGVLCRAVEAFNSLSLIRVTIIGGAAMNTRVRAVSGGAVLALAVVIYSSLPAGRGNSINAQTASGQPATYVGTTKCAPCHFSQFAQWKQDSHAKAFEILPAKYKQDASCLKCHTTGYGEPSGYHDETTLGLAGTTCEACHGPGSDHVTVAQKFVEVEITPAGEEQLRASIAKVKPDNACVHCHLNKAHRDPHPPFDQDP